MFPAASDSNRLRLFSGSANVSLAQEVARYLGMDVGPMIRKRFADGELYIQIQESIRGCDVYLIQPCCNPVNDHLMELLIMIDACRRASARQITAVIPYYGYARADRKTAGRESIAAKLVANLITEAGASRVLAMDLHSAQIQGYFDIPFDHVYGSPVVVDYLLSKQLPDIVVVSPDVGGVARARMIDTAGTIAQGAQLLKAKGARQVYACATHPVFSGPAIERLSSGIVEEVIVTNTIPVPQEHFFPQLKVLPVAPILGEAIWRIHEDNSVSNMFK